MMFSVASHFLSTDPLLVVLMNWGMNQITLLANDIRDYVICQCVRNVLTWIVFSRVLLDKGVLVTYNLCMLRLEAGRLV